MKIIGADAAYQLAGPGTQRSVAGGVQVLMRPDGTAILITEAPERLEHHWQAREVVLPWQPAAFDEHTALLLERFDDLRCRVLLWLPEGLADLGWGRGSLRSNHPLPGRAAIITLDGPVDWEELDLQRSLLVPLAEPAPVGWLEHALSDRRRAVREFAAGWFPRRLRPARRPEFQAPPQIAVPSVLADFYRLAHHHPDLLGRRYHGGFLYPSAELEVDQSGRIRLGGDGDHGPGWRLAPGGDDPSVLAVQHEEIRDDRDGWLSGIHQRAPWREREPLSGVLLQFALYAAAAFAPYRGVASTLTRRQALALLDGWQRVPLQPLLAEWEPVTFAVAPGRIACLYPGPPEHSAPDVDDCWLSIAATHPGLLNPLDIDWHTFTG
ncbi:hypothetical protein [Actinomadura nitritigenes]|uniref:hypothetical protein n=1 Tax=Actinomadura nitritigenes TaxID=134602 RepID=UPI003D8E0FFD